MTWPTEARAEDSNLALKAGLMNAECSRFVNKLDNEVQNFASDVGENGLRNYLKTIVEIDAGIIGAVGIQQFYTWGKLTAKTWRVQALTQNIAGVADYYKNYLQKAIAQLNIQKQLLAQARSNLEAEKMNYFYESEFKKLQKTPGMSLKQAKKLAQQAADNAWENIRRSNGGLSTEQAKTLVRQSMQQEIDEELSETPEYANYKTAEATVNEIKNFITSLPENATAFARSFFQVGVEELPALELETTFLAKVALARAVGAFVATGGMMILAQSGWVSTVLPETDFVHAIGTRPDLLFEPEVIGSPLFCRAVSMYKNLYNGKTIDEIVDRAIQNERSYLWTLTHPVVITPFHLTPWIATQDAIKEQ